MATPAPVSPLDDLSAQRLAAAVVPYLKNGGRDKWVDRLIVWGVGILLAWTTLQVDVAVLKQRVSAQDELLREVRSDVKLLLQRVR